MGLISQVLWAGVLLLFFAGAVTYALNRHLGVDLLKRAAVLLAVLLIGPSLVSTAISELPFPILVLFGIGASLAAYSYLANCSSKANHKKGSHTSHAERHPRLPNEHGEEEE
jgi:hypothetical protein